MRDPMLHPIQHGARPRHDRSTGVSCKFVDAARSRSRRRLGDAESPEEPETPIGLVSHSRHAGDHATGISLGAKRIEFEIGREPSRSCPGVIRWARRDRYNGGE